MTISINLTMLCVVLLFTAGIYCLIMSRNILRLLIGIEVLSKAVILAFISFGHIMGMTNYTQSFIITIIVVEVVVIAVALALAVKADSLEKSIDIWNFNKLRD